MAVRKNHYPEWAYPSYRAFKSKKRTDLRNLIRALDEYRIGCAYLPGPSGGDMVDTIAAQLRDAVDRLSQKNWGR